MASRSLHPNGNLDDALTDYSAYLNTDWPSEPSTNRAARHGPAAPRHLAVRVSDRSNGTPLATIVEQGSRSTLDSCGSLLGAHLSSPTASGARSAVPRVTGPASQHRGAVLRDQCQENTPPSPLLPRALATLPHVGRFSAMVDESPPVTDNPRLELGAAPRSQIGDADPDAKNGRAPSTQESTCQPTSRNLFLTNQHTSAPVVRLVRSEARHVACVTAASEATTSSNDCTNSHAARPTLGETSLTPGEVSSLHSLDSFNAFSRNASFSSTMSTSYSGTVLGVDSDLQHEMPESVRHWSSPMPVSFTPQMAELERQASIPNCSGSDYAAQAKQSTITSSALTSLLPIAAASGVVQTNCNTPRISFYSPSGSLIQPAETPSPEFSKWSPSSLRRENQRKDPTHQVSAHKVWSSTECLPPTRPTLLPLNTLPTLTSPLPANLTYQHSYQRPRCTSTDINGPPVQPTSPVYACGGIVRTSPMQCDGTVQPPKKRTAYFYQYRDRQALVHEIRSDLAFYKSRYIGLIAQSCGAPRKGKELARLLPGKTAELLDANMAKGLSDLGLATPCVFASASPTMALVDRHEQMLLVPAITKALDVMCTKSKHVHTATMRMPRALWLMSKSKELHADPKPADHLIRGEMVAV
ncbi:hypothetical protein ACEQ8H_006270 [Pleosporales sp. CAS-2024a]